MNEARLASQLRVLKRRAARLVPNTLSDEQIITAIRQDDYSSQVLNQLFDIIEPNFKVTVQVHAFLRRQFRPECRAAGRPGTSLDILCEALSSFPGEQRDKELLNHVDLMTSQAHEPFRPGKRFPLAFHAREYLCQRLLARWTFDELQCQVIEWWAKPETVVIACVPAEQAKRLRALTEGLHVLLDSSLVHYLEEEATLVDIAGQCRTALSSAPRRTRGGLLRTASDPFPILANPFPGSTLARL